MNDLPGIFAGCEVTMYFKITLEDGTVADTNFDEEPITFIVGDGTIHEGLELALMGQVKGKKESIKIGPEIAFGYADDEAIVTMPKSDFPKEMDITEGSVISFTTPNGEEVPGIILEDLGDEYKVDLNHPLAGHELDFEYEILNIKSLLSR